MFLVAAAVKISVPILFADPSTVEDREISAAAFALQSNVVLPGKVMACKNEMFPFVVMFAPRELAPAPVWLNTPADEIFAPLERVNRPALLTVTPPPVVDTGLLKVKAEPVRLIPPAVVVKAPKEAVPVPAFCVID